MLFLAYNIALATAEVVLRATSIFFSPKLRRRNIGIVDTKKRLKETQFTTPPIWFHVSSAGEYEQAKPVIASLKQSNPEQPIVATFFSPSGYEAHQSASEADFVGYLPYDSYFSMKEFIRLVNPKIVVAVRYEIWLNMLMLLKNRSIPSLLICAATLQKTGLATAMHRLYLHKALPLFTAIFPIQNTFANTYRQYAPKSRVTVVPDTRYDRILQTELLTRDLQQFDFLRRHLRENILVVGSSWEADEAIYSEIMHRTNVSIVIAPHNPTEKECLRIKKKFHNSIVRLSQILDEKSENRDMLHHLLIDSVGKLLSLYSIADAAYIGGGFGSGVHSTAEPAGFGMPIACGTNINNSPDAQVLKSENVLTVIKSKDEFVEWFDTVASNSQKRNEIGKKARAVILAGMGSAHRIASEIAATAHITQE